MFTVRRGGHLFQEFLKMYSPAAVRKTWRKAFREKDEEEYFIDGDTEDQLIDRTRVLFHTWVLHSMSLRSQACNRQLFYTSVLLQFRGLSRTGLDLPSKFSLALPTTTCDRYKQQEVAFIDLQMR
jgi:hypothetical protein